MVLHTFGRDLKWNPHIHCLITEGGYSDDGFWKASHHFNYTFLRNAFRTALLNEMETILGPSFKKTKAKCYTEHKHGFYVYAKPNKCDPTVVTKYIGRYLGRPFLRSLNKWRVAILGAFDYDSLKCPDCGHEMNFLELYFNHQRIFLEEMYENVMSKSRRKRSSP